MRPLILIKLFLIKIELFCFIFRRPIIIPISFIIFTLDFSSEDFLLCGSSQVMFAMSVGMFYIRVEMFAKFPDFQRFMIAARNNVEQIRRQSH